MAALEKIEDLARRPKALARWAAAVSRFVAPARTPLAPRHPDFERLVGAASWGRLPQAVKRRFAAQALARPVTYHGTMTKVRCSTAGLLLAWVCRLIGTPLAPYRGSDVPTTVRLYEDRRRQGIVWERLYRFPGKRPLAVRSTKVFTKEAGLLEVVGGGIGMILDVSADQGGLQFRSRDYFWDLAGLRMPLPLLFTPGEAHVVHRDEGGGWFRFTMTMTHPILGETFFQDGLFREPGDPR